MNDERYIHYSEAPLLTALYNKCQDDASCAKPNGLWFSVERERANDGWRDWCVAEKYRPEALTYVAELELDESRICRITSACELDAFDEQYTAPLFNGFVVHYIDWRKVAEKFAGIIIAPYIWERRLRGEASGWYYGWDCASGCVWDASAVNILEDANR